MSHVLGTYSVQFIFVGWKKGHVEWSFKTWKVFGRVFNVLFCFPIILKFWFAIVYLPHAPVFKAELLCESVWEGYVSKFSYFDNRLCSIYDVAPSGWTTVSNWNTPFTCTDAFWFSSFPSYTMFSNKCIKRYIKIMCIKIKNIYLWILHLVGPRVKWYSRDRRPHACFSQPLWNLKLCRLSLT